MQGGSGFIMVWIAFTWHELVHLNMPLTTSDYYDGLLNDNLHQNSFQLHSGKLAVMSITFTWHELNQAFYGTQFYLYTISCTYKY